MVHLPVLGNKVHQEGINEGFCALEPVFMPEALGRFSSPVPTFA